MIDNPWAGKTPEEIAHPNENEYIISFTMRGEVSIWAKNAEEAREKFGELGSYELSEDVGDVEIDSID